MAGLHEAAIDTNVDRSDVEMSIVKTEQGVPLQHSSASSPPARTTANPPRHEPSLLGLPAELRLIIYDFLTSGDRNQDLDVFPIGHFALSPGQSMPDYPAYSHHVQLPPRTVKSWSWIHTCRTIFEEGRWNVIKTHLVSFRSEGDFNAYDTDILKTIQYFHFSGFHTHCFAARVEKRLEKPVYWRVVHNFHRKNSLRRLGRPERSIRLETSC
ncbi:hypothetical protein M409DRAFT_25029 [Zasmidium cellare ATCC 36951]|uniref:Uncharacterized protein n=1 Tax=Zasmidium cellare ATCC 36951 TaxID=1080233 RepID=A0A6A6CD16_ZASCE|nr:uncharacterized protein M409DRAFT_25029 [Zasmidium cellare ATCC 36951]KAF2164633.1 hypothetical protein M409DRAFT_25029 [Zasmidium cellare ATCC 36951]